MAPRSGSDRYTLLRPRTQARRLVTAAILAGFAALFVVAMLEIRPWAVAERRAALEAALVENRALFAALPLPGGAIARGEPEEAKVLTRRNFHAAISREWDVPGRFAETDAFLTPRLVADGWSRQATLAGPELQIVFCRHPHMLALWKRASFENETPPFHRVRLELRWSGNLTAEDCRAGAPQ